MVLNDPNADGIVTPGELASSLVLRLIGPLVTRFDTPGVATENGAFVGDDVIKAGSLITQAFVVCTAAVTPAPAGSVFYVGVGPAGDLDSQTALVNYPMDDGFSLGNSSYVTEFHDVAVSRTPMLVRTNAQLTATWYSGNGSPFTAGEMHIYVVVVEPA